MDYLFHILVFISITIVLSLSLNLVVGYTGLLSVTHAAFYGIGAYVFAIATVDYGINFFVAQGAAVLGGMFLAGLIGILLSRFRGDYYALCSVGFNTIVFSILLNAERFTHGALGVPGVERPVLFGASLDSTLAFLCYSFACMLLVYLVCRHITKSSFGRVLKAIREDQEALQVFGYRTSWFKFAVFVMGAGIAAFAGTLFASYISFIDPTTFKVQESVYLLSVVILGGLGSLRGAIIGAVVLQLLPEVLRFVGFPTEIAGQMRQLVYGLMILLCMLYRPRGIWGEFKL